MTRLICLRRPAFRLILPVLILLTGPFSGIRAQFYNGSQLNFGKSRVQYNDFFWTYFRFDQFDTYFYLNGKELAQFTAEYADQHIREIELMLQSGLDDKIQFIIFNNLSDLKQSNIGLYGDWDTYNTGGVTRIVGGRVLLFFDGDYGHFVEQIRSGIAQVILNQMMYGTGIGAQIKNNALFTMPDWYMAGLVSYVASGWNTRIDDQVREAVLSGKYAKFNRLTGMEATLAGHSLWRYIAVRYGDAAIPNIVYMARMSRNIEKGFQYVLGLSYKALLDDWLNYYSTLYRSGEDQRSDPDGTLLNRRKHKELVYRQLKVSPDGSTIAYATHYLGVYKVFLQNTQTGKKRRIFRGGYRLAERPDYSFPLLAWHPTGNILAILTERKGESWLYFYDIEEKKKDLQILYNFQKILDMGYSGDGRRLAFSAVQKGQSDLFVYDIAAGSHEQLTNDIYDDLNPRFLPGSSEIIFSSNRPGDTVRFYEKPDPDKLSFRNDIFIYPYSSRRPVLKRITKTPMADEIQPMPYADNYLCYLSDANGIYNRYLARFDSAISFIDTTTHYRYFTHSFPVTDYRRSILEQDISLPAAAIAELVPHQDQTGMYLSDLIRPGFITPVEVQPTAYAGLSDQKQPVAGDTVRADSARKIIETSPPLQKQHFRSVRRSEITPRVNPVPATGTDTISPVTLPDEISPVLAGMDSVDIFASRRFPAKDTLNKYQKAKPLNYNVEYSIDEMVTQIDFTYLNTSYQPFSGGSLPVFINPGLNVLFMAGVTDLMEDYRH